MSRYLNININAMRAAGRIAADILKCLENAVQIGISTLDLDLYARDLMKQYGAQSACYGYKANGLTYPGAICVSINEEVVHGIPSARRIIQDGDLVSLDVCVEYDSHVADNAKTIAVGNVSEVNRCLINVAEQALHAGINNAVANNRVGDITSAIQKVVEDGGFSIVKEFVGHGIGRELHQDPQVPNCGLARGQGQRLKLGMALAIEPMINAGLPSVVYMPDGWTVSTLDRKPSVHCEHTIFITENGPEVLTLPTN